jgi:peptide deformylase
MAKMQLKYFPNKILKQKAKKISQFDASLRKLAADMLDTMYDSNGVGLAAPQVGVSKRIMIIDVSRRNEELEEGDDSSQKNKETEPSGPMIFINPVIIKKEGEMVGLEGCLSFPGVFFEVRRASHIVVRYQNLAGKEEKLEVQENLLCRAIQHEIDHLDGELFIDKAVSPLQAQLELSKHGFGAPGSVSVVLTADDMAATAKAEQTALIG